MYCKVGYELMNTEFKKEFFGYNVEDVELKTKYSKDGFNRKFIEYQEDLTALKAENEKLNREAAKLRVEIKIQQEFNAKIEKLLRTSYEKTYQEVYETKTKLDRNVQEKNVELESLQNKNQDINNSINKLLAKLENILGVS